jgi:YggT family protein
MLLRTAVAGFRVRRIRRAKGRFMSDFLVPFIELLLGVISLYRWCVIAMIVMSWLVTFNVVNTRNRAVYVITDILYRITEPVLRPLRRLIHRIFPNTGPLDLSPLLLFFILWLVEAEIRLLLVRFF